MKRAAMAYPSSNTAMEQRNVIDVVLQRWSEVEKDILVGLLVQRAVFTVFLSFSLRAVKIARVG